MVDVGPLALDLGGRPHEPQEHVEVVRRLVDEYAAAFSVPAAAPRVGAVVARVAPAIHEEDAEARLADLAGVDGLLHPSHRLVPAPLTDNAERHPEFLRGCQHGVAVGQARGPPLLDPDVKARLRPPGCPPPLPRVPPGPPGRPPP